VGCALKNNAKTIEQSDGKDVSALALFVLRQTASLLVMSTIEP
jgi:hypothetical protein